MTIEKQTGLATSYIFSPPSEEVVEGLPLRGCKIDDLVPYLGIFSTVICSQLWVYFCRRKQAGKRPFKKKRRVTFNDKPL